MALALTLAMTGGKDAAGAIEPMYIPPSTFAWNGCIYTCRKHRNIADDSYSYTLVTQTLFQQRMSII